MVRSIISLAIASALSAFCVDATTVAVMELGKGGVLHRTSSSSPTTSAGGIVSFWKSTHDADSKGNTREYRTVQFPEMTVVPDIFSRADGGVVVGVTGAAVDLSLMPTLASLVEEDGAALGHFHVEGKNGRKLLKHVNAPLVNAQDFSRVAGSKFQAAVTKEGNLLESILVHVDDKEEAAAVDASLARMLKSLDEEAKKVGSTIVVHLVLDDEDTTARRRLLTEERRKIEENNDQEEDENSDYTYTIPGYYDSSGNFITPFKTIFQIQYYNIVQWTAIGLFTILLAANYMTINMPLMPDTLLFGESAKMVAE
eukprot:scaffold2544_cov269-Chaetoceros_neogracile.AAC.32